MDLSVIVKVDILHCTIYTLLFISLTGQVYFLCKVTTVCLNMHHDITVSRCAECIKLSKCQQITYGVIEYMRVVVIANQLYCLEYITNLCQINSWRISPMLKLQLYCAIQENKIMCKNHPIKLKAICFEFCISACPARHTQKDHKQDISKMVSLTAVVWYYFNIYRVLYL